VTSSRRKPWTPEEDSEIKAATWAGHPLPRTLARQFGRTTKAVLMRAAVLRKTDPSVRWATLRGRTKPWTKPQLAELRRRAETEPIAQIAASMGRTIGSCKSKLGSKRRKRRWTKAERSRLADLLAQGATVQQIAAQLDRSGSSVHGQIRGMKPYRKSWTAAEDAAIIEGAAARTSMAKIAEQIGRTVDAVRSRANKLRTKGAAAKWVKGSPVRRHWTTATVRELITRRERGESYSRIAAAMGRTVEACRSQLAKHHKRVALGHAV